MFVVWIFYFFIFLLACLEESCDTVEAALVQLEDLSEQLELKQHKTSHIQQLEVYKKKKDDDLRKMKGKKTSFRSLFLIHIPSAFFLDYIA